MSAISAEPIALAAPELGVRPYLRTSLRVPPASFRNPVDEPLPREAPRDVPRVAPRVQTRPRARSVSGRKNRAVSAVGFVLFKVALFGSVALPTWFASNLAGHVMAASAHKQWHQAHERADSAVTATSALRNEVIAQTSDQAAEQWALAHHMVASEDLKPNRKEKSQLVALNP